MRLLDIFKRSKREPPLPDGVKRVFKMMDRQMEGRRLADEAISFRNVGSFDKALDLLKSALYEYEYTPAITLWGTTLLMKGDVQGAIDFFSRVIKEPDDLAGYPLIEAYANLGSIYNQHVRDYQRSLDMYEKGLAAPCPPSVENYEYDLSVSLVYHDIAIVYWNLQDMPRAREYSFKCLARSADLDDSTRAKVHLRLGRILLEMAECTDALIHAKKGIQSFDDPKTSEEYCSVAFSALYAGRLFKHYFEQPEPFTDLEDIVSRLERLRSSKPEDAQSLFLLVASNLCLALSEYYWRNLSQRNSIVSKFLVYREAYASLMDSEERTRLLSKISVEMLSEKTGVLFDLPMFEEFLSGLGFPVGAAGPFETESATTSFSALIPPTRGTEIKRPETVPTPNHAGLDGCASDSDSPPPDSSGAAQHDASSTPFSRLAQAAVGERDASRRKQAQEALIRAYPGGRAGFEECISTLIGGLTDPDRSAIAVLVLRGWGEMAVPYLDPVLASDNRELRQAVVEVLILIGRFKVRDQA
jgi:tetratricopeptide (TPR) repeat protein